LAEEAIAFAAASIDETTPATIPSTTTIDNEDKEENSNNSN
jgi:hypothetical protein